MNKEEKFNQVEKIFKLKSELTELKEKQKQFTKEEKQYWELGAKITACQLLLKNLTSICAYCQKDGANFDLENEGKLAHYECYQKWWELKSKSDNN